MELHCYSFCETGTQRFVDAVLCTLPSALRPAFLPLAALCRRAITDVLKLNNMSQELFDKLHGSDQVGRTCMTCACHVLARGKLGRVVSCTTNRPWRSSLPTGSVPI